MYFRPVQFERCCFRCGEIAKFSKFSPLILPLINKMFCNVFINQTDYKTMFRFQLRFYFRFSIQKKCGVVAGLFWICWPFELLILLCFVLAYLRRWWVVFCKALQQFVCIFSGWTLLDRRYLTKFSFLPAINLNKIALWASWFPRETSELAWPGTRPQLFSNIDFEWFQGRLLCIFWFFLTLAGTYHTVEPYVIAGQTTAVYTCFVFANVAPQVDAVNFINVFICVTILASISLTCGPHLNLMFNCTPKILMSGLGFFGFACYNYCRGHILNFLGFRAKYINSYFFLARTWTRDGKPMFHYFCALLWTLQRFFLCFCRTPLCLRRLQIPTSLLQTLIFCKYLTNQGYKTNTIWAKLGILEEFSCTPQTIL